MKAVVFTAALGATDILQPPAVVEPSVRYLCFTDRPCPAPYERVDTPTTSDPKFAARRVKVLADHPLLAEADATLWHDASYRLLGQPSDLLRRLNHFDAIGLRHPRRKNIEAEAVAIARWGYVTPAEGAAIVAGYRASGFHKSGVLTCTGLLARRVSPAMQRFNRIWWSEVERWRGRDQGSVDYAAWRAEILVGYVKGTIKDNPFAAWRVPAEAEAVPA